MIVAILAIYGAILALLEKLGIIKWNRYWTLSFPVIWAALQLALLLPMAWSSPQGSAIVLRNTVAIAPSVTGEVIDVPVHPNTALKAATFSSKIDPTPYEAAVNLSPRNLPSRKRACNRHEAEGSRRPGDDRCDRTAGADR